MSEVPPEDLSEAAEATAENEEQNPEEYEPGSAVSPDTGTVYEGEGEPASTPHDVETGEAP